MQIKAVLFDCFGVLYVSRQLGFRSRLVLNQPLLDFSQTLRPQYKVGLLTNMGSGVVDKYFTRTQLIDYFDKVVISGDINVSKPHPDIYKLAAQNLGLEPAQCLLIDDSQVNCDGAEQAGMKALLYNSTEQVKRDLAELLAKK